MNDDFLRTINIAFVSELLEVYDPCEYQVLVIFLIIDENKA